MVLVSCLTWLVALFTRSSQHEDSGTFQPGEGEGCVAVAWLAAAGPLAAARLLLCE